MDRRRKLFLGTIYSTLGLRLSRFSRKHLATHAAQFSCLMADLGQNENKMNSLKFLLILVMAVCSFLWNSVDGSHSKSGMKGPPSPPRNLRRSVVGALGANRQYHVFWSASHDTGGLSVNYSVQLCVNDSIEKLNNVCIWSSNSDCHPRNIITTKKDFSCILNKHDFENLCGMFCNYTLCVKASNDAGNATSCIFAPPIDRNSVTPQPPLKFSAQPVSNGELGIIVRWEERIAWSSYNTVYTVLYHSENQPNNKTEVIGNRQTLARLSALQAFMNYCVYLMVQFVNNEGVRSPHSDVLGPLCLKTPAGEPASPPRIERDQSVVFPDNAALRNVTVEWKRAKNSSWNGTPHEYHLQCKYHRLGQGPLSTKCEYVKDAASNSTVLQGLNSADSYNVYVQMCNKEQKCSAFGDPYVIRAMQDDSSQPLDQGKLSGKDIALITGSVVLGCVVACIAIFFIRKWLREQKKPEVALAELGLDVDPTDDHEYSAIDDSTVQNQYHRLNDDEENA